MKRTITISKHAGFCAGVKMAYKTATEASKNGLPVYMLGHLVHNTQVIEKLGSEGIKSVNSLSDIPDNVKGLLMISAHGIGPSTYEQAKEKGLEIADTTCVWVKTAQKAAKSLSDKGYSVIIVGDRDHTEVKGIMEWAGNEVIVVERSSDLDKIAVPERVALVAQTTQSIENFNSVAEKLKGLAKDLVAQNTICDATSKMQKSAVDLARVSDVMLVIGDKRSANTKRLKELSLAEGVPTYQIQNAKELDPSWLEGKQKIGITAGASTPEWVIDEVVNSLTS